MSSTSPVPSQPEQIGRYRILGVIGRGSMGIVYRAEDVRIGRTIALKVVPRPQPGSPSPQDAVYERFLREARAAGALSHPNVVTVHDVGEDEVHGLSYIAMEFVDGEPLDQLLRERRRLPIRDVLEIGAQVADALAVAHTAGVVHRDIKPANLLRLPSGQVKVTDFGIAKLDGAAVTHDGTFLGSPSYMSPEQVKGADVDARSDLFSLGIVLYELLTLRQAFPGKTVYEVIGRVVKAEVTDLAKLRPDLQAGVREAVAQAMAPARADRFPSAAAMASALRQAQAATASDAAAAVAATTVARPAAPVPATGPARRYRALAVLAGAAALLMLALGYLLVRHPAGGTLDPASPGGVASRPPQEVAAPTPEPVSFAFAVEHLHDFGGCDGQLAVFADRVEFTSRENPKDSGRWSYASLRRVTFDENEVALETEEKRALGLAKRYRFVAKSGRLPRGLRAFLGEHARR